MTQQFIVIEESGYAFLVNHEGDDTLRFLQTAVDGLIEYVPADVRVLGFFADLWVNEEGLFRDDFGVNLVGSQIANRRIVGPMVIARSSAEGETIGLSLTDIYTVIYDEVLSLDDNNGAGWSIEEVVGFRTGSPVSA